MSDVPDELLREILSRLPVAPLLRFRCVSKSWKGLIDSDQFIKHHLNHSRKTDSNVNVILGCRSDIYSADFDLLRETNMASFKQLSHPLKTPSGETNILGSCDGLLVLRNHEDNNTILWNPSVKRFHVIPSTSIEFPEFNKEIWYGFGYDVVSDDYKLIRIVQFYRNLVDYNSEVKVYSLKADSWKRIPDFPYYINPTEAMPDGVLANGALHWIVARMRKGYTDDLVAAIDLGTEEYRLVPLPKFADDDYDKTSLDVLVLGGCLSLIMCSVANTNHFHLWVMKEYGVQESWSVLFSYDICHSGFFVRPLAYSKCGCKVLLVSDNIVLRWYDLDKISTHVHIVQMPKEYMYEMYTCLQSLVLLNNGVHDFGLVVKTQQGRTEVLETENIPGPRSKIESYQLLVVPIDMDD